MAKVSGIDVEVIVKATWFVGGFCAVVAGVFLAMDLQMLETTMGFRMLLPMFAAAILGEIGRPFGAVVGGLVIGLAEELSVYPWFGNGSLISPGYKTGVAFAIMVIMLVIRPVAYSRSAFLMDMLIGYSLYGVSLLTVGGIYAILALGLNIQWGYAGLFNVGIAGFAAIGAYTFAIMTTAPSAYHFGGLDLPLPMAIACAMLLSGLIAFFIGLICIRLRSDYLAISTIGIAEIIKLFLKNETELTNGPRGINKIPRVWEHLL